MKKLLLAGLIAAQPLMAQELIPATSEDIQEFDRQVTQAMKRESVRPGANFGAQVSEEAKKLKEESKDKKKEFGKWVSKQRSLEDQERPSAKASFGSQGTTGRANGNNGKSHLAPGRNKNPKNK